MKLIKNTVGALQSHNSQHDQAERVCVSENVCEKRRENGEHFHFDCPLKHIHTSQIKGSWACGRK